MANSPVEHEEAQGVMNESVHVRLELRALLGNLVRVGALVRSPNAAPGAPQQRTFAAPDWSIMKKFTKASVLCQHRKVPIISTIEPPENILGRFRASVENSTGETRPCHRHMNGLLGIGSIYHAVPTIN